MLRPSFVPPAEIRQLRDYTRLRTDLTRERTRHWSRLEKLLEDALIKVTAVAGKTGSKSVRDMVDALIAGQRDPHVLAGLARGKMRARHDRLAQALDGRFDDHHGELARILLDQIDALGAHIGQITGRAGELIQAIPAAWDVDAGGVTGPAAGAGPGAPVLPAVDRLDEITGIGAPAAQVIIAEIGLNMSVFPTPGIWCPGRSSRPGPSSPGRRAGPARPARATPTSRASWARPPRRPAGPPPSSASATGASPGAAARSGHWSPRLSEASSRMLCMTSAFAACTCLQTDFPSSGLRTKIGNDKEVCVRLRRSHRFR
jgi:transposase